MMLDEAQLRMIHRVLHGRREDNTRYDGLRFAGHRYMVNLFSDGKIRALRLFHFLATAVEQNPETDSPWAERARAGELLTWVFRTRENGGNLLISGPVDDPLIEHM